MRHGSRSKRNGRAGPFPDAPVWLYGLHTVTAALRNPARTRHRLVATRNALARLPDDTLAEGPEPEMVDTRALARLLPPDAVHQGIALLADPLRPHPLEDLGEARLVVVLDQITDPHNVGAVMRSAVAFAADALVTMTRHSPAERGALAKAASGALDLLDHVEVANNARAVEALRAAGFLAVALDSAGETPLEALPPAERIALVLGAEGKGVRRGVRAACDVVARLELPGAIRSLNVSNAAALALYVTRRKLAPAREPGNAGSG